MATRTLFLALCLIGAAAAFNAPAPMALRASKTAMTMKAEGPMPKLAKALAPAIAAANLAIASPVFAEGTGEALGIDDTRLIVPVILIPVITFILYAGFAAEQDNEDFFDTYDQRRK